MKRMFWGCLLLMPWLAEAADLEVANARVRMPPPVSETAAVYMDIRNADAQAHRLTGVTTDAAAMAMFHGRDMQALHDIQLEPGEHYAFAPGGAHIMLMGLKRVLHAGERIRLLLQLDGARQLQVQAIVQDMR